MNSERDRINQWEYAMEQAKTEGLAEGRAEEKSSIAKCTGLTIDEIEQL